MKRYKFHGAFADRQIADKKAKIVGGKVTKISVNGKTRYTVYTVSGN